MRGGTFNLLYGRDPKAVKSEVTRIVDHFNLDFLGVQESADYVKVLRDISGYKYFTGDSVNGGASTQIGILVKDVHRVSKVTNKAFGDGWISAVTRKRVKPRNFISLILNNRDKVACLHFPASVGLKTQTPVDRYGDYVALSNKLRRFMGHPSRMTRTAVMDGNALASNQAKHSPAWVAKQTKSKLSSPDDRIDYILTKGLVVDNIKKAYGFREKSDHELVIFDLKDA